LIPAKAEALAPAARRWRAGAAPGSLSGGSSRAEHFFDFFAIRRCRGAEIFSSATAGDFLPEGHTTCCRRGIICSFTYYGFNQYIPKFSNPFSI